MFNILDDLRKVFYLFKVADFKSFKIIFLGMLMCTFFEIISLGSVPVFIILLLDPSTLINNEYGIVIPEFILNTERLKLVVAGSLLVILIFIIKNLYLFLFNYYKNSQLRKIKTNLQKKLFSSYLYAPYLFHLKNNPAYLTRNLIEEIRNCLETINQFLHLFLNTLISFFVLVFIFSVDFKVSIIVLLILGIFSVTFYSSIKKKLILWGKQIQQFKGDLFKQINESINSIKEIKIYEKEKNQSDKFFNKIDSLEKIIFVEGLITLIPIFALEIIAILLITSITSYYLYLGKPMEIIIPLISLYTVASIKIIPAINKISLSFSKIKFFSPSLNLINDQFSFFESFILEDKNSKNEISIDKSTKITFEEVSFTYKKDAIFNINNISTNFHLNQNLGLVGPSGAGKTTLINLITGLIKPTNGVIKINNENISSCISSWRNCIGYVPQDVYLMDDSIKKNIAFGIEEKDIDFEKVKKVAKIAQIHDFILSSESGFETLVGDRGIRISGGQKQRIGIARALYRNPKIIIFDEATSNLDLDNENNLLDEIHNNIIGCSLIIISHRKNSVKYCDKVLLLEKGKLIKEGSVEEIFKDYD